MLNDDAGPGREAKVQRGWRLRQSLVSYLAERAKSGSHGAETRLVEDAIALHQALYEKLSPLKQQLAQYALDEGLDLREQEAEVLTKLVLAGLKSRKR